MNTELMFSSKDEKWQTPDYLFQELNKEFNFTLDPCCQHDSSKCKKYFTPVEDGLKQDWSKDIAFVNPPYGRELKKWVEKSYLESLKGSVVVMLIPSRTDTVYFHEYIYKKAEIRFLKGRIKFINPKTKKVGDSAPFPSMIVIFDGSKYGV